jgi:lysyl-tRNA synthetase class 2
LDEAEFSKFHSNVKRGDIVGTTGFPGLWCYILPVL